MTDREWLEAAAKAAGYLDSDTAYGELTGGWPVLYVSGVGVWDPLGDDGDALRLASKLRLLVDFSSCCAMNLQSADDDWFGGLPGDERIGCSPAEFDGPAVVRRAIVRAAATMAQTKEAP